MCLRLFSLYTGLCLTNTSPLTWQFIDPSLIFFSTRWQCWRPRELCEIKVNSRDTYPFMTNNLDCRGHSIPGLELFHFFATEIHGITQPRDFLVAVVLMVCLLWFWLWLLLVFVCLCLPSSSKGYKTHTDALKLLLSCVMSYIFITTSTPAPFKIHEWFSLVKRITSALLVLPWLLSAEPFRSVFKGFPYFNIVQSKVFEEASTAMLVILFSRIISIETKFTSINLLI